MRKTAECQSLRVPAAVLGQQQAWEAVGTCSAWHVEHARGDRGRRGGMRGTQDQCSE